MADEDDWEALLEDDSALVAPTDEPEKKTTADKEEELGEEVKKYVVPPTQVSLVGKLHS